MIVEKLYLKDIWISYGRIAIYINIDIQMCVYVFIGDNSWDCWPFVLTSDPMCANGDWRHFPFSPPKFLSSHIHKNRVSITVWK